MESGSSMLTSTGAIPTVAASSNVTATATTIKSERDSSAGKSSSSDLRSTKTELFNKLVASQSQQMIVTTPDNNKNGAENLNQADSQLIGTGESNKKLQSAACDQQQHQQQQCYQQSNSSGKQPGNNNSGNSNNNQPQHQLLLPEDFKREAVVFARSRSRWYTNEEVASILTNFSSHPEWQTNELQVRPKSGAVLLYSREKVRYRQDGYCWKKRKNGRTTREDHMKLKVQGIECIYGCYVHSAILPTFHRRCYWLLQNPDIVLVHYLNQPPDDQNKMMITFNSSLLEADTRRSWTNEEIIEEIGSVFGGISQIQHTLNINFPPSASILHQRQQQQAQHQTRDLDRMIESSPQSEHSHTTTVSEAMDEQVDMTVVDHQQQHGATESTAHVKLDGLTSRHNDDDNDEDEMMSTISLDNSDSNIQASANNLMSNVNCDAQVNGHGHRQQQLQQDDDTTSMTFDIVNECSENQSTNILSDGQPTVDCFGYSGSNCVNVNVNITNDNNENNNNQTIDRSSTEDQAGGQMEQNLCSPVTQIYNKIVDDIETYALPLEPNQFNSSHHHSLPISSLPVQSMEIGETAERQPSHHHHHPHQGQQQQQQQHHSHHHDHSNRLQAGGGQLVERQQFGGVNHSRVGDGHVAGPINKCQPACSMDLTTCDLFGNEPDQAESSVAQGESQEADEDDNLLLTEFNLQSSGVGQVNDELGAGVVDSLTNVDDLRDLIMGISSNGNTEHANLLVDTNSLDLFNFKPADCDQRQQLDVKSSISDTDTMNRLSPMVPVPRCNSTGNAMQPSSQHLGSQFHLTCTQSNLVSGTFNNEFHNFNVQRSSSTNPGSSTSCSLSPSSSSQRNEKIPHSNRSTCTDSAQYTTSSTTPSSHSFIKLPLQQRQKSEQQEPSNSVLNSLLPKALSLDGSELSAAASYHRLTASPLIAYEDALDDERQQHQNLLLIPPAINRKRLPFQQQQQQQQQPNADLQITSALQRREASSLSPSAIPLDNSSEILVNHAPNHYRGSPAYTTNVLQHTQQLPTSGDCAKRPVKTTNALLPILDYVPNWCNITGGAKVLIVGNWSLLLQQQQQPSSVGSVERTSSGSTAMVESQDPANTNNGSASSGFYAIFDDLLVPATLIQDNVLRCYAPSHEQGFITLKVLYMNQIVSEQVLFEMRPSCNQTINQQVTSMYPRNNQSGGHDPSTDNNTSSGSSNNNNNNGNNNTQHRNAISSNPNQSTSSTFSANQKPQVSPSGNSSVTGDNSKVLTLAENIISAMHKKNNSATTNNGTTRAPESRLASSLDIEYLDQYQQQFHQHPCQRQRGFRGAHRRLSGSRSLSRDSEPGPSYTMNFGIIDSDPYWHKGGPLESAEPLQPLSVITDFMTTTNNSSGLVFSQKRHSSGSSGFLSGQQSAFMPYGLQRPTLASVHHHHQGVPSYYPPNESQNQTETSSSGLGSIVSSLSPSTSSLHSPSSACNATTQREGQSPCSCGRQSSGTPTSADFCEYFQASANTEESFASLTLNDREQQELYEAAKVIQKAYRTYRGRKRQASELLVEPSQGVGVSVSDRLVVSEYQTNSSQQQQQQQSGAMNVVMTPALEVVEAGQQCDQSSSNQLLPSSSLLSQQHFGFLSPTQQAGGVQQQHQQQQTLVKCYQDREMQAATIIQAYYRRYRQYVHYKRQQQQAPGNRLIGGGVGSGSLSMSPYVGGAFCGDWRSPGARLVVDTMPIVIGKATSSHVDRKRFKTATLISSASHAECSGSALQQTRIE